MRRLRIPTGPGITRRPRPKASYAQAGEDRIALFLLRDILRISQPSYIDIGAYHPFDLSNTALLYLGGSRGINVEPDPRAIKAFRKHRKRDVNLNVGVGAETGRLTFYRMSAPTLSTFSRVDAERIDAEGRYRIVETIELEVRTLAEVLSESPGVFPDFLSLDVEGGDVEILRTLPTWPGRPAVICVETLTFAELGMEAKVQEARAVLEASDYVPVADTYVNTFFVDGARWRARGDG